MNLAETAPDGRPPRRRQAREGALALWRSGALALWRSGALALWRSGALALWRSGALALWRSGALALWRSGALALWRSGALNCNAGNAAPMSSPWRDQWLRRAAAQAERRRPARPGTPSHGSPTGQQTLRGASAAMRPRARVGPPCAARARRPPNLMDPGRRRLPTPPSLMPRSVRSTRKKPTPGPAGCGFATTLSAPQASGFQTQFRHQF